METVRTATQPVRDDSARKEAEGARLRYPAHLAQACRAARGVKRAVDPVRAAVTEAGVRSAGLVRNGEVLTRLPRTAEGINALGGLIRELPKLQQLPQRLGRLRADLTDLQKRTRLAQHAARIRARDKLIEDSAPPSWGH